MTAHKGKAIFRRYRILTALVVVNVLASTSITNGYPITTTSDTSYDEYYIQDVGEYLERLDDVLEHHKKHHKRHHREKREEKS